MTGIFDESDDATPLTPDEKLGLIPDFVFNRADLNRVEQQNIIKGQRWAFSRKRDVLDMDFLRRLHRQMFNEVWEWAGTFRTTARNIGIEAGHIAPRLHDLIEDAKVQIEYNSYPPMRSRRASITGWSRSIPSRMAMAVTAGLQPTYWPDNLK